MKFSSRSKSGDDPIKAMSGGGIVYGKKRKKIHHRRADVYRAIKRGGLSRAILKKCSFKRVMADIAEISPSERSRFLAGKVISLESRYEIVKILNRLSNKKYSIYDVFPDVRGYDVRRYDPPDPPVE